MALLILEQVDGNFIGPKIIIGDRLDMRPLWIIFSVTIGGGLFGVVGLFVIRTCHDCDKDDIYGYFGGKGKAVKKIEREEDKA